MGKKSQACRRNARKTRKRKGEGRQRKRREKTKGSRRRTKEKRRRRQEEASHCQHVPSLRWIPPKSREEQTKQTPDRARKEEEDPGRAQKAPQHRPFGRRKTPRKSHRILDRLVCPRRRKIRSGTKNQQTKIRHQPTPPKSQRVHGQILQEQENHQGGNLRGLRQIRLQLNHCSTPPPTLVLFSPTYFLLLCIRLLSCCYLPYFTVCYVIMLRCEPARLVAKHMKKNLL